MDLLDKYYGKETFLLYSLFAKVPGTKNWPRKIFVTFSMFLLLLGTGYQLLKVVIESFRRDVIIELLPTSAATIGTLLYVPYIAYATEKEYNVLLSIILDDLRKERTEEEDAIKEQFAKSARMFVKTYTIIFLIAMCGVPLSGFIPYFLDLLIPLNETRERRLFVNGELFIDQEKYFYHMYALQICVVFVVGVVIGVSENMGVIIGQHACGMFEILGYRLENITHVEKHRMQNESDYAYLVTRKLVNCIKTHQEVLHFSVLIAHFYDIPLTLILTGTFSALTASLVLVTDPEMINTTMFFFTIAQIFQLFVLSYMGQSGIDASLKVAVHAYNADWYSISPNIRKLFELTILRSSKACTIVARSMYTFSVENFISVMQTITSFYMVLRQTS